MEVTPKNTTRCRRISRLKDEIYRQMFFLEERRPAAKLGLAIALLRAWVAADTLLKSSEEWAWLMKISPLCLEMIGSEVSRSKPASALLH